MCSAGMCPYPYCHLIPRQPSSEEGPTVLNHAVFLPIKMQMQLQVHNNTVTECSVGTSRQSKGFQLPHLNCQHLLTCLFFSSFRLKTSLLRMFTWFWASLRIASRSWLWSKACSDAERAGEHAQVSKATAQQALLEETALRMTTGYQKHQDSCPSHAGPRRESPTLHPKVGWDQREPCVGGNQHPSLRKDAQLCCGQDNDTGCAAKATSKLGSSEANYEEKSQILLHSCGTAISNNSIQIIFLLLRVKATLPTWLALTKGQEEVTQSTVEMLLRKGGKEG